MQRCNGLSNVSLSDSLVIRNTFAFHGLYRGAACRAAASSDTQGSFVTLIAMLADRAS